MVTVVISTPSKYPCPAGEYHYSKLPESKSLKAALQEAFSDCKITDLIDPDHDIVGFDLNSVSSVEDVLAVVRRVQGGDHGLAVYNPYAVSLNSVKKYEP